MIISIERGPFSYAFGTIYSPLCSFRPENLHHNKKLWNWGQRIKTELPIRTPLIIGTDANGHAGNTAMDVTSRSEDIEVMKPIGPHLPEKENPHGTVMREFLEASDIVAANTYVKTEAGHTWTRGITTKHRVDFILMHRIHTHIQKHTHTYTNTNTHMHTHTHFFASVQTRPRSKPCPGAPN